MMKALVHSTCARHVPGFLAGLLGLWALTTEARNAEQGAGASSPASADVWSFDIVPYLWLAGYEGTFGLPNIPTGIASTHSDASSSSVTHISAAAMLAAQVRYRDVGLFLDGAWLRLSTPGDSSSSLYSGTEITSDIGYGTMALSYRLPFVGPKSGAGGPLEQLQTDLLAGARVWFISNEIEFKPGIAQGFTADASRTWADPIVGASLHYDLTRHWFATVLGDVGGFGVGSEFSWNVYGGVGYRFTSWLSATLGYRYMHVDYDKDGFLMNVNVQGFLLGLGFRF
jgi:opacity protein-like surface antigen